MRALDQQGSILSQKLLTVDISQGLNPLPLTLLPEGAISQAFPSQIFNLIIPSGGARIYSFSIPTTGIYPVSVRESVGNQVVYPYFAVYDALGNQLSLSTVRTSTTFSAVSGGTFYLAIYVPRTNPSSVSVNIVLGTIVGTTGDISGPAYFP